jgi:hypothetical protein
VWCCLAVCWLALLRVLTLWRTIPLLLLLLWWLRAASIARRLIATLQLAVVHSDRSTNATRWSSPKFHIGSAVECGLRRQLDGADETDLLRCVAALIALLVLVPFLLRLWWRTHGWWPHCAGQRQDLVAIRKQLVNGQLDMHGHRQGSAGARLTKVDLDPVLPGVQAPSVQHLPWMCECVCIMPNE